MQSSQLIILLAVVSAGATDLHEVHSSSWSGGRVRSFALSSSIKQASDVLQCAALAAKHLLTDQLLVFIPRDRTQQPQCIVANRSGAPCRRLTSRTPQSPCCIRVFVTSLSDCWISIQRRVDNSTDFYRNWSEYAAGFGDGPHTNHWLGLRTVHSLTWPSGRGLRIRMRLWNDTEYKADYSSFSVASEADKFRLFEIAGFRGSDPLLYDSFASHKGAMFSTSDFDNDGSSGDCSNYFKGGWWFSSCYKCSPNGLYYNLPEALNTAIHNGIVWKYPFGADYSMMEFEMLVNL